MLKKVLVLIVIALLSVPTVSNAQGDGSTSAKSNAEPEVIIHHGRLDGNTISDPLINAPDSTEIDSGQNLISGPTLISDPSGWQSRGSYHCVAYADFPAYCPDGGGVNWISAGGNFKVAFTGIDSYGFFTVQLREYDAEPGNEDEKIGKPQLVDFNSWYEWKGIDEWIDGGNNEGEFYLEITNSRSTDYFTAEGFD